MTRLTTNIADTDEAKEPETTQDAPSAAPPRDANGFELDDWGLPVSGPIRAVRLAEMAMPDPLDDPKAWKKKPASKKGAAAGDDLGNGDTDLTQTENQNG
jgi:hypothetical protein